MALKNVDKDRDLLRRAKEGDYPSFEALVERHERRLFALSMGILRQREDAENVVQTTFLKALENLKNFREDSTFGTWISRIATHTSLNVLRKRKGLRTVSLKDGEWGKNGGDIPHPKYVAPWRDDPVKILEGKELRRILAESIDSLGEKYRVVFLLRDVEGLSVAETAEVLEISEANVKVRLLRARLALREKLTAVFGDESRVVSGSHEGHGHGRGAEDASGTTPAERLLKEYEDG